jgi:tryptophan synthase alpha chain
MNRINSLFQKKQTNILSVYFTAGYPKLHDTREIICELERNGIDQIEIGIPFSDPMADGPVIQQSSTQALRNGMSLKLLFAQLEGIRREVAVPLILMGYLNPIIQYGFDRFCEDCRRTGIDGMIIPDLPFKDYMEDYKPVAERYGLKIIMLITPDTSVERIRFIDENTDGFIYMVSSASTTGAQQSFDEGKQAYFRKIDGLRLKNPRLIGFGISNKKTLDAAFDAASGGIVGSKFIQCLGEEDTIAGAVRKLLDGLRA